MTPQAAVFTGVCTNQIQPSPIPSQSPEPPKTTTAPPGGGPAKHKNLSPNHPRRNRLRFDSSNSSPRRILRPLTRRRVGPHEARRRYLYDTVTGESPVHARHESAREMEPNHRHVPSETVQYHRAEPQEEQKADLGRKFAKRDRRPVDPPPVVRLRMYQVFNAETDHPTDQEIPAEQIEVGGLICHVDLYAIRPTPYPHSRPVGSGEGSSAAPPAPQATLVAPLPAEESKVTTSLFGTTFAHASQIKGLDGDEVIFFVFPDLAVRTEGLFILRYRMFDILSRMEGSEDIPVLAQCYSGPFAIYSTTEYPGLRASTELTKHLSRYGIRVNLRESERKRKAAEPPAVEPEEPAESSSGRPPHLS
ncbi:velvet factor-domain-containing protein [Gautieria morchelliformis]|nr:velvet factor-domain-containing protein [Gautieria morchelliformis]